LRDLDELHKYCQVVLYCKDEKAYKTEVDGNFFIISITHESDCSYDGGYTFEDVTNTWSIDKETAKELIVELQHFVKAD